MIRKLSACVAAGLALLALAAAFDVAEARRGGGARVGGGPHSAARSYSGAASSGVRHFSTGRQFAVRQTYVRHHHGRRLAVVGAYLYAYTDGCGWLRRRAAYTGSAYWWQRYYACRQGYY
jgi:hypothetical protein